MREPIRHWAVSHPGTARSANEDAFLCRPEIGLFAVADGVGGHACGGEASAAAMCALAEIGANLAPSAMLAEVRAKLANVHEWLMREAVARHVKGMATTVVVLLLHDEHLACMWAGDSRAYLLRAGTLVPITSDHSVVGEMVRAGKLTDAQALKHPQGNIITRGIGIETGQPLVDKIIGTIEPGDRYLLCTDGLTKVLSSEAIANGVAADKPAEHLVQAALASKAGDNVTVVVALPLSAARPGYR